MKSCLLIAGEKSGEEHAMSFFPELRRLAPEVNFYGVGGDLLHREGLDLIYHLRDFSSMGFSEVIGKLPFYLRAMKRLEETVVHRKTETAIVIDFQDFNLRLARRLAKRGVRVLYYVAPQAWAWKPHRAQILSQTVHTLFTILPFERNWFSERGVHQVRSIPHPLSLTYRDELKSVPPKPFGSWREQGLRILLLPGSRRSEIASLLPAFIETVRRLRRRYIVEVHLVKVSHVPEEFYASFSEDVDVVYESDELVPAMRRSHFALAASGTVTLSTGLFELPTVVCYRTSLLNEFVFHNFIKYQGPVSLTNIILGDPVFPEFLQDAVSPANLHRALLTWIEDQKTYNETKAELASLKGLLSGEDFSVPEYMARVIHE